MKLRKAIARILLTLAVVLSPQIMDQVKMSKKWIIQKFHPGDFEAGREPFEVSEFSGNILLDEGITALENLLIGDAETNFGNSNANLGVGDSATGESAAHTGLQASTNKLYKAVEAGYPTKGNPTTWRAIFTGGEANFAWNEFTVASGNSDAADNLNRKVSAQGTKTAGQTWTLDLQITWS